MASSPAGYDGRMRQQDVQVTFELADSLVVRMKSAGNSLANGTDLYNIEHKHLLLSSRMEHGQVHVYRAHCHAGERVRVQLVTPSLPTGRGAAPSFAVVAQGLPYRADVARVPVQVPHGYTAIVALAPDELCMSLRDAVTGVLYYPGPVIDTRMLVSGVCYIIVWSPQHLAGKYMLSIGYRRSWTYWLTTPFVWWRLRGWYGLNRTAAYVVGAIAILLVWLGYVWRQRMSRNK